MFGVAYHEFPERDEATICLAFLHALTTPDGQVVMDELYRLQQQLPSTHELRQALGIVWPYLLDTMRRGQQYQTMPPEGSPEEPPRPY